MINAGRMINANPDSPGPGTPGRREKSVLNQPRPDSPILKAGLEGEGMMKDTKKLRPLSLGTNVNRWREELEELKRL